MFGRIYEKNMDRKNNRTGKDKRDKIEEIFADEKQITEALQRAVLEAVEMHKRAGNPIVVWKEGEVVWIERNRNWRQMD